MPEATHPPADHAAAATWAALRRQTAPAGFIAAVADLLAGQIDPRRPLVDLGTGSGHLAQALAERGATVVSLDLSVPMLEQVPAALRRVAADAVALPLPDGAAGAALAAHVLHVIPAWRDAIAELDRVVGPHGVILVQSGPSSGVLGHLPGLRATFRDRLPAAALAGSAVAGPDGDEVLAQAFAELGRQAQELPVVSVARQETARGLIRWMQGNAWTWPGPTTDAERAASAAAAEAWALAQGVDLDEPFETTAVNRWRAYRRPPATRRSEGAERGPG